MTTRLESTSLSGQVYFRTKLGSTSLSTQCKYRRLQMSLLGKHFTILEAISANLKLIVGKLEIDVGRLIEDKMK